MKLKNSKLLILFTCIALALVHRTTGHKAQFRVLGLQYGTLHQRFELENKLLRQDMDTAKSEIKDLKADNARIIKLFEVFTEEVRDLKATLLEETLKLKSLESDFKMLHSQYEDLKSEGLHGKANCTNGICNYGVKRDRDDAGHDYDKESKEQKREGKAFENNGVVSGFHLLAARYGEKTSCYVNLQNFSVVRCVERFGEGVRVMAADKDRIYWSDDNRKLIMSSAFTGSDVQLINTNLTTLGMAVDPLHKVLFYTNVSGDVFRKTLTNTNDQGSRWTNIGQKPRRIFVDAQNKLLYAITDTWTSVVRINYFTNRRELVASVQGKIKALTVDIRNQILYFSVDKSIYVRDLVDKAVFPIFESTSMPSDLVVMGPHMYVAYYHMSKIDVIDLKTREITRTVYLPWEGNGNTVSICLVPKHKSF